MSYIEIPDLLFKGAKVYTLEEANTSTDPAPTTTPPAPTPPAVPDFVAPNAVANRIKMVQHCAWVKGGSSFYSTAPLTDNNCWLICFTPSDASRVDISTAEYQGENTPRNWQLIRNRDGLVIATFPKATQTPALNLNGTSSFLVKRIPVDIGERYTWGIWNAVPGISSRMVGQLVLS